MTDAPAPDAPAPDAGARAPALSALVVAKDEAARITAVVAAVRPLVAEVVVVDTGSSDETAALAGAAGARVLHSRWLGYGPTKNWGAEQCAHDWIWSLDADEVPDAALGTCIRTLRPAAATVYGMRRVTNYRGRWIEHGAWGRDVVWRVYDRRAVRWDERPVHENLIWEGRRERLAGRLLHDSYPTLAAFDAKREPYLRLSVEALRAAGKEATWTKRHLAPAWRWVRGYVLQAGFLDGRAGWEIAAADYRMVREKYRRLRARRRA